jgi:ABC-2 type transport system permease protein
MTTVRILAAAFRLQVALTRRSPGHLMILLTAPLFSVIFLSFAVETGRKDAVANAVLAPGLIGLWAISLDLAGSVIGEDRWGGRFELLVATLTPLGIIIFGRILVIILAGAVTFGESWLVTKIGFGLTVPIADPPVFAVIIVVTCFAMAATATLLASAFVLSRALHVFQNALSYPVYILGGIVVPVAALPGWVEPASRVIFLSWSAGLLRAAMRGAVPASWPGQSLVIAGLGAAALAAGVMLINTITDRSRRTATMDNA